MSATEPAALSRTSRINLRAIGALVAVALLVYAGDRLSKAWVVASLAPGEHNQIFGEILQFVYVKNLGAAFSLASGSTWIFSIAASAVAIFIIIFARRIRSFAWAVLFGMLLGGTIGNLTDRLFNEPSFGLGHVTDFILVWGFPAIFNVADIFICSAMGLFIILTIRGVGLDGSRAKPTDVARAEPAESVVDGAAEADGNGISKLSRS